VALYPLRQPALGPWIDEALRIFRGHGLHVEAGTMSSVITGETRVVFQALEAAFEAVAAEAYTVMTITVSNACPADRAPPAHREEKHAE
jgi:uncharacterized protein YqgV (UPF0045/DUF77 family)